MSQKHAALLTMSFALALGTAQAAEKPPERPTHELTAFGGYRFGGTFKNQDSAGRDFQIGSSSSYGLTYNFEQQSGAYYEFTYSVQNTTVKASPEQGMKLEYLHVGGHVEFGDDDSRVIPYFVLTIGATRFTPDDGQYDDLIEPSIAAGVGFKWPFSPHFALRGEARAYATLMGSDTKLFCVSDNGTLTCAAAIKGDTLLQAQALFGATYAF